MWFKLNNKYKRTEADKKRKDIAGFGFHRNKSLRSKKGSHVNVLESVTKGQYDESPIHEESEDQDDNTKLLDENIESSLLGNRSNRRGSIH